MPRKFSSLPICNFNTTLTVLPLVFFGSKAPFRPFGKVKRVVRASILSGLGSNASPCATTARPV
ncbi:hypothetical protein D3C72_1359910 [compost metagenome]